MGTCVIAHSPGMPARQAKGVGTAVHVHNEGRGQAMFALSRLPVTSSPSTSSHQLTCQLDYAVL
jgi:hypothetical protein